MIDQRIDRHLNLIIPILDEQQQEIAHVHHTPLSTDVFRKYWKIIGQTMNAVIAEGLGIYAPRYAAMMMKDIAELQGIWADRPQTKFVGVQSGLFNELIRLTEIFMPGKRGWESIPFYDVKAGNLLSDEHCDFIEGCIVFFTCGSRSHLPSQQMNVNGGLIAWNARLESLDSMELLNSLRTSSAKGNSGETAAVSLPT